MSYHRQIGCFLLSAVCFFITILPVSASSLSPQKDEREYDISVLYSITVSQIEKRLEVTANFADIPWDRIWIGFPNSNNQAEYSGSDLASRVYDLIETSKDVELELHESNENLKLYEVSLNGHDEFSIKYIFDPKKVPYDNHFTELTETTLHIPGKDFLIRVFASHEDTEKYGFYSETKKHIITIKNMPQKWQIITTYDQPEESTVVIDDREGDEILLSAGNYRTSVINSGDSRIRVSFDKGLKIDISNLVLDVEKILKAYFSIYNDIAESDILLVVNQNPQSIKGWNRSFRGQSKKQNIVNSIGWGDEYSEEEIKRLSLSLLAHEIHHLWLSHAFIKSENWSWCWEGITEYISEKILLELQMIPKRHFSKHMERRYIHYCLSPYRYQKSLVEISLNKKPTSEEYDLIYNKGTIVSYLIDLELQKRKESLEIFLRDFYNQYAKNKIPVNNEIIIDFINDKLGNNTLTQNYILGKVAIPQSFFQFSWRYYFRMGEVYLANLETHIIVISSAIILTFVLALCLFFLKYIRKPSDVIH